MGDDSCADDDDALDWLDHDEPIGRTASAEKNFSAGEFSMKDDDDDDNGDLDLADAMEWGEPPAPLLSRRSPPEADGGGPTPEETLEFSGNWVESNAAPETMDLADIPHEEEEEKFYLEPIE
jgi:hypothetical protein